VTDDPNQQAEANEPEPLKPPRGFTKAKRAQYLDMIREGMRPGAAALAMGFNRAEFLRYLEEDLELADDVRIAEIEATEIVEEAIFQAAASGNVPAARTWLEMKGEGPVREPAAGPIRKGDPPPGQDPMDDLFGNVTPIDPRLRTGRAS